MPNPTHLLHLALLPGGGPPTASPATLSPILSEGAGRLGEYLKLAQHWAVDNGPRLLLALAIWVLGRWATKALVRLARKGMAARRLDEMLTRFLCRIIDTALLIAVAIAALDQAGIQTTSFVAVLGAATLAVGFALQGSLSNFAAGVMIVLFRPFRTGDFIEAGGTAGIVEEVSIFATLIRTGDNKQVIVPNSSITGGTITNYSTKETRRIDLVFGIGYDDDIEKAKSILAGILAADERVLKDPAPTIAIAELAESSVNIACRPWVRSADYWPVRFHVTERVKLEFDAGGISMPYPQRDVHVHQVA